MSNPAKAKGSRWEAKIVDYLTDQGLWVQRIPAGATADPGDIWHPMWCLEAKDRKAFDLSGWMNETVAEQAVRKVPYHALWVHRPGKASAADAYVLMTGEQASRIMKELEPQ